MYFTCCDRNKSLVDNSKVSFIQKNFETSFVTNSSWPTLVLVVDGVKVVLNYDSDNDRNFDVFSLQNGLNSVDK